MLDIRGADPAHRPDMVLHLRRFLRLLHSSADPEPFEPRRSSSSKNMDISCSSSSLPKSRLLVSVMMHHSGGGVLAFLVKYQRGL
ncbi:hypothetical protein ACFX1T_013055 [Malus domestica]